MRVIDKGWGHGAVLRRFDERRSRPGTGGFFLGGFLLPSFPRVACLPVVGFLRAFRVGIPRLYWFEGFWMRYAECFGCLDAFACYAMLDGRTIGGGWDR